MEIEQVIKIYDFLGNLDFVGFIALCILLSIGIFAVYVPLKEKKIVKTKIIAIIIVLINVSLLLLYIQAQRSVFMLHIANFIKQDFIASNYKQKGFPYINFPDPKLDKTRSDILHNLVDKFPNEFLLVKLYVAKDSTGKGKREQDTIYKVQDNDPLKADAIALIDTKARDKIDSQIKAKAILTGQMLAAYMKEKKVDTISIYSKPNVLPEQDNSLHRLDNTGWLIGPEFFKALIGISNLRPLYDIDFNITGFTLIRSADAPRSPAVNK